MATVKNTMELVKNSVGKINPYYDMTVKNVADILNNSNDVCDAVVNAFRFGYVQGMKSANSKKAGNKNG